MLFPGPPRGLSEVGLTSDSLDILGFGWFLGSVREARLTSLSLFTLIQKNYPHLVYLRRVFITLTHCKARVRHIRSQRVPFFFLQLHPPGQSVHPSPRRFPHLRRVLRGGQGDVRPHRGQRLPPVRPDTEQHFQGWIELCG